MLNALDPNAYGLMSYRFSTIADLDHPKDFAGISSSTWLARRDQIRAHIAETLWPEFGYTASVSLAPSYESLLAADFEILSEMRPAGTKWFDAARITSGKSSAKLLFLCEDAVDVVSIGFKATLDSPIVHYPTGYGASFAMFSGIGTNAADLPSIAEAIGNLMLPPIGEDVFKGINWINLSLKHLFQRPRPHQYAFARGHFDFVHALAQTPHSPALPSGHAFQHGVLALFAHSQMQRDSTLSQVADLLPAWAASVGDRRNFAGLHFPSDNWASWLVLACTADLLYSGSDLLLARSRIVANILSSQCYALGRYRGEYQAILQRLKQVGLTELAK